MLWEHYAPKLRRPRLVVPRADSTLAPTRFQAARSALWSNRTLVVAIAGLAIVIWLNWGRGTTDVVPKSDYASMVEKWEKQNADIADFQVRLATAEKTIGGDQQTIQDLKQQVATTQSQLQDTKNQLAAARQAAHQPPPPPPPEDQIPIKWQSLFQISYNGDRQLVWIRLVGQATAFASIKDAYLISENTGHRAQLKAWMPPDQKRYDVSHVDIPAGSSVDLIFDLSQPLSVGEFLSQWGTFEFHVIYPDKEYTESFDQFAVEGILKSMGLFGPHVTPKD